MTALSDLVSVVIPVFNGERYLRSALESVMAQSHAQLDILVVDDGSTDSSPAILAEIAAADSRLRVARQANAGISSALNAGVAAARGALIARMDADDLMLEHRVATQAAFLRANPDIGFCASYMDIIDGEGRSVRSYMPQPVSRAALDRQIARAEAITYTHPTVMYRTEVVRALGGYDPRFEPCEDTELFGRMISSGRPGLVIPEVLMRYRMHGGSISGSKARRQVEMLELVRRNFYLRIEGRPEIAPERRDQAVGAMPLGERLAYRANIASQTLRQVAGYDRARGRPMLAALRLLGAATLQPHKVLKRLARPFSRKIAAGLG